MILLSVHSACYELSLETICGFDQQFYEIIFCEKISLYLEVNREE